MMYKKVPALFWWAFLVIGILLESVWKIGLSIWMVLFSVCFLLWLLQRRTLFILLVLTATGGLLFNIKDAQRNEWYRKYPSGDLCLKAQLIATPEEGTYLFRPWGKRNPKILTVQSRLVTTVEQEAEGQSGLLLSDLNIGDVVQLAGVFIHPRQPTNPGQFDYGEYLFRKGSIGTYYVAEVDSLEVSKTFVNRLETTVYSWMYVFKKSIKNRLDKYLSPTSGAVLYSLLTGDRQGISDDIKDSFSKTGVSHILAVSGLHVSLVAAIFLFISRLLHLGHWGSFTFVSLVVSIYVCFTGAAASSVRAGISFLMVLLAVRLKRRTDPLQFWSIAGLVLLTVNPLYLWDVGFQLSFAASFAIIHWVKHLSHNIKVTGWKKRLAQVLLVNGAAQAGTTWIVAYHFNQISLTGFFLNPVVVSCIGPVITLALFGVFLCYLPLPYAHIPLRVAGYLLELIVKLIEKVSLLSWSVWEVGTPSWVLLLCCAVMVVAFPLIKGLTLERTRKCSRFVSLFSLLTMVFLSFGPVYDRLIRKVTVTFIDVGQGDAVLIRTAFGQNVLIDGGGGGSSGSYVGEYVLLPLLKHLGVKKLDVVINTHPHDDHLQGLLAVLENRAVGLVLDNGDSIDSETYKQYQSLLENKGIPRRNAVKGDKIVLAGGMTVEILHPADDWTGKMNDRSLVLRIDTGHGKLLLAGDLEKAGQQELLFGKEKINLRADVVKVPHHGSGDNLVLRFIDAVAPGIAVIQVGSNQFGHPSNQTIQAYAFRGAAVYRTDQHGAIDITISRLGIKVKTYL